MFRWPDCHWSILVAGLKNPLIGSGQASGLYCGQLCLQFSEAGMQRSDYGHLDFLLCVARRDVLRAVSIEGATSTKKTRATMKAGG